MVKINNTKSKRRSPMPFVPEMEKYPFKLITPEGISLGVYKTREEAEQVLSYASASIPNRGYKKLFKIVPSEASDFCD